ncbi:olfactory receptor 11L1-like [Hyperolius riggenbachi]|uniref:olfactory receptor 11L1-like n=1 Tax=Hyperolius riggenbachi TaxID=752182 RepID=UPI0035A33AD1
MIHLLGFQTSQNKKLLACFLFLLIYCITLGGNLLLLTVASFSKSLHSPMYFFLSHLSVADVILINDILPFMLHTFLVEKATMSLSGCITQYFFFALSEASECLLLTAMCYDRYLAICQPLHYNVIMSLQCRWLMVTTCWLISLSLGLIPTLTISTLYFCGPNIVDHFFCDLDPLLQLSCTDTTIVKLEVALMSAMFVVVPFFVIIVSYVYIIVTIFKIPSVTGRKKAFSTCSSHLTVVSIYYCTLVCVYLVPRRGQAWNLMKFLSLLYTVITPTMNPIIYSLRNKDLKNVVEKIIKKFLNTYK